VPLGRYIQEDFCPISVRRNRGGKRAAQKGATMEWGTVADWLVAFGTLVLAIVAIFQETIRGWVYRPSFRVSTKTEPPDSLAVPFTAIDGTLLAKTVHLRLWVENVGNATAMNVEVYAAELRRQRADGTWERVGRFPPMNLSWSDVGGIYFSRIAPEMGKHCDIAHVTDPARRAAVGEDAPMLDLTDQQCSLAFNLITRPNHRGHIVGPGKYRLDILVAADNVRPLKKTLEISLQGPWNSDDTKMLRDHVGIAVL
jgi:hypothetical protein